MLKKRHGRISEAVTAAIFSLLLARVRNIPVLGVERDGDIEGVHAPRELTDTRQPQRNPLWTAVQGKSLAAKSLLHAQKNFFLPPRDGLPNTSMPPSRSSHPIHPPSNIAQRRRTSTERIMYVSSVC
ncbi:hypothetical protein CC78DRAFT_584040 [Lojkania enalia]|uniref:Uncharacterized protein n=1 Tax=Lojkania enalia TaxID=147567 RepID=A0A9P4N6Y9_9PLEO|nr:hypothetical protein CC78DRAFT_584040 [Didymosphaeria enalia]